MYLNFRLAYGSQTTQWIKANPNANEISYPAVAFVIQDALMELPVFNQVTVTGVSAGASQGCLWKHRSTSSSGQ